MDNSPDWSLLRSFLAVAEAGSLSGAARVTGISQPTLGRHIRDLEASLGIALFTRATRGLTLTDAGAEMLPPAQAMRAAAAKAAMAAAGRESGIAGPIRLTASRTVALHLLPPMLTRLRRLEPSISVELIASDTSENLLFREADIALRMYRPTQLDLIASHVADLPMGLYGTREYLDRTGRPETPEDLQGFDFIGFLTSDVIVRFMHDMGLHRRAEDFALRCDDQLVYWNLVRAGCGLGAALRVIGDPDPMVERIAPFLPLPTLPVWLTAPQALHQTPRIRRVYDFLSDAFKSLPLTGPSA